MKVVNSSEWDSPDRVLVFPDFTEVVLVKGLASLRDEGKSDSNNGMFVPHPRHEDDGSTL